ncbi:c-type cytochrome [Sphingosinicella rhizophila]|uniref:Cytochrome c n=1 Tax=Sphingosinicella rhizophila TaxID=3050082 RepID=A0ABU3QB38_9SPHN|nr:cytochrome c [Sphingosinicella sp. GR2756]MDT9600618.1 cytochrome c [Sphingosinicella sp. GR2756]
MKFKSLMAALACVAIAGCGGSESDGQETAAGNDMPAAVQADGQANGQAPVANAAESIKTRQTHYKEIGRAMKGINDELKKDAPDVAAIQAHAGTIDRFAPQIQGWFPDGTGAEAGVKTGARAEIWSKPEEFRKVAANLVTEAGRFNAVAATGDLAAIREGVKPLGAACKVCHDQFRAED